MNLFSPAQIIENYGELGKKKAGLPALSILLLGVLAGALIAFGAVASGTASHAIVNVSVARLICGLVFPFGLGMVMIVGAELFTGNCLMVISLAGRKITMKGMLKNWILVYAGNFCGALLVAAGCVAFGQLSASDGGLAVHTAKIAVNKVSLSFLPALGLGFFCNLLVALGVLMSMSAKDTSGKLAGAYLPVAFFVICGFEHCVANMYYVPAGIFAARSERYAALIAEAGVPVTSLTWGNFLWNNLLPVTVGNILGGAAVGLLLWAAHCRTVGGSASLHS